MAIPKKDALLVEFSTNFNNRIVASPSTFSLTAAQAAAYTALHNPYVAGYQALMEARAAGTQSASLTNVKDTAKAQLLQYARELYTQVQASLNVTEANKILLGIHIRQRPSPVPAPSTRPTLRIKSVYGTTVLVNVFDADSAGKRGKAPGAIGANVYSFVGAEPASDPAAWQFHGQATKPDFEVHLPDSMAGGSKVWITATWYSRRGDTGPLAIPQMTRIQGGLSMAA